MIVWLSVDEGLLWEIEKEGEGVEREWMVACRDIGGLERFEFYLKEVRPESEWEEESFGVENREQSVRKREGLRVRMEPEE